MNPNLQNNSSNNYSGGYIQGTGNTITNNVDQSRRTIAIGSVAVVIVLLLVGFGIFKAISGSSLDGQLVGTWSGNDSALEDRYHYAGEITFKSDHTYIAKNHDEITSEGTWKTNSAKNLILSTNDGSVTLVWEDNVNWTSSSLSWNISGDVMYIGTTRYDRQ